MAADPKNRVVHAAPPPAVAPPLLQRLYSLLGHRHRPLPLLIIFPCIILLLRSRRRNSCQKIKGTYLSCFPSQTTRLDPRKRAFDASTCALPIQPGGTATRRGEEAAGAAERGHARHPWPGGPPRRRAPGRAVAGGGGDVAEFPRAAEKAEHLHPGLHTRHETRIGDDARNSSSGGDRIRVGCLRLTMFSEMRASRRLS